MKLSRFTRKLLVRSAKRSRGGARYDLLVNHGRRLRHEELEPRVLLIVNPLVGTTIEGINLNEDAALDNNGAGHIPPDPHGAVGPAHVVSVVNTSIEWHTRQQGLQQTSQSLRNFFAALNPVTDTFDPKVIYDQYANRFVVVTLERTDDNDGINTGDVDDASRIFVAVSDNNDPNGTWFFHSINSETAIGGVDHWADYPGFAVDEEAVYITNNMLTFGPVREFGGSRLWIINKGVGGGFYAGGGAAVTVHDPYAGGGTAAGTQPAHIFGAGGVATPGIGTWLVSYDGFHTGANEFLQVVQVSNPITAPAFLHNFVPLGNIDNTAIVNMPDAPQLVNATLIETNDRRTLNAVWRGNSLWTTFQVVPETGSPNAGEATAHWVQVSTAGSTVTTPTYNVIQQGDVGGEEIAGGTHTFMPSIAVDAAGNMALGFSASAAGIHPGA